MSDYPEPTPEMLDGDPLFDAIWHAIKGWDISRHNDGLYSGPTGNDVRHIYDAIRSKVSMPGLARRADSGPSFRDIKQEIKNGV